MRGTAGMLRFMLMAEQKGGKSLNL